MCCSLAKSRAGFSSGETVWRRWRGAGFPATRSRTARSFSGLANPYSVKRATRVHDGRSARAERRESGFRRSGPWPRRCAAARARARPVGRPPGAPRPSADRRRAKPAATEAQREVAWSLGRQRGRVGVRSRRRLEAKCRSSLLSSVQRVTARSMALRSSRTFPGQLWLSRNAKASSLMGSVGLPACRQTSRTNSRARGATRSVAIEGAES